MTFLSFKKYVGLNMDRNYMQINETFLNLQFLLIYLFNYRNWMTNSFKIFFNISFFLGKKKSFT